MTEYIKCDAVVRPTLNEVVLGDVAKTDTRPFIQNCAAKCIVINVGYCISKNFCIFNIKHQVKCISK